jgi:hypothetical protein
MITNSNKLIEIFYSYASIEDGRDEELQKQLEKHLGILKRQGKIATWHKRNILAGQTTSEEVIKHLNSAHIILLLISPDFVASDQCWDVEMERALERQQEEKTLVIPVMLRPLDYREAPFSKLYVLPRNGKPVTSWPNQDEAFEDIARNIRLLAEKFEKTQKVSWKDLGVGISLAAAISTLITSSTSHIPSLGDSYKGTIIDRIPGVLVLGVPVLKEFEFTLRITERDGTDFEGTCSIGTHVSDFSLRSGYIGLHQQIAFSILIAFKQFYIFQGKMAPDGLSMEGEYYNHRVSPRGTPHTRNLAVRLAMRNGTYFTKPAPPRFPEPEPGTQKYKWRLFKQE